jgi:hypothetical protein
MNLDDCKFFLTWLNNDKSRFPNLIFFACQVLGIHSLQIEIKYIFNTKALRVENLEKFVE